MTLNIIICAVALSFGWGIRGTITGGYKGAMVAGALIGLALSITNDVPGSAYIILTASGTISFGFGGMMTYGQTLGLTMDSDPPLDYWKGIVGTFVKGSVWIGLGGLLLGMSSGRVDYNRLEWSLLVLLGIALWNVGITLLNRPMAPPNEYPRMYFSSKRSLKDASAPHGRTECWGGLWSAFLGLLAYSAFVKGDLFSAGLAIFGLFGGGIGFSFGQAIQSWGSRRKPFGIHLQGYIDWWKVMEFTFGGIAGGVLSYGWMWLDSALLLSPIGTYYPTDATITLSTVFGVMVWVVVFVAFHFSVGMQGHRLRHIAPLLLYLLIPYYGMVVSSQSFLWAHVVAGPLLLWTSSYAIAIKWKDKQGIRAISTLVGISVIGSVLFILSGHVNPSLLWTILIVAHLIYVLLKSYHLRYLDHEYEYSPSVTPVLVVFMVLAGFLLVAI